MSASQASNPAVEEFTFPLETIVKNVDKFLVKIQCAFIVTEEIFGHDQMDAELKELYALAHEALVSWQMCAMAGDEESYYK